MYQKSYDKTIERIQSAVDLAKDCSNMKRCEENLRHYNRERSWACLQDMLREYAVQIDTFGFWVDGVRLIKGVRLPLLYDCDQIRLSTSASERETGFSPSWGAQLSYSAPARYSRGETPITSRKALANLLALS